MAREKTPGTPTITPRKRAPAKRAANSADPTSYPNFVDPQQRAALIARAAYFRAMHRGFAAGHEAEDWLAAETEVDADLLRGSPGS